MKRKAYGRDAGLTVRMLFTGSLLGLLYVFFALVLFYIFNAGLVLMLVIVIGMALFQYFTSDKLALRASGAKIVTPEEAPKLHEMIERLAAMADLQKPRVAIVDTPVPNAFATGRNQKHAVVAVTSGLWERLDEKEIEGVLAHELTHIANRDVLVMTVASSAGIAAGMLTQGAQYGAFFGRSRSKEGAIGVVGALVISLVIYAISFFLLRLLSRYRELCADRAGAYLTMKPAALATALQKISGEMAAIPQQDLRASKAMNAFFIAPAISGATFKTLTSTHPSLEQRLEQLAKIQAELGRTEP